MHGVDTFDPACAPGTGVRVCGGLTSRETLARVRGLARCPIAGFDVVDVCPALDSHGITNRLAAQLLLTGLAASTVDRRRRAARSARG